MIIDSERQPYRDAANDALQQLDWCIGYLDGIGKGSISRCLARNRRYIIRNLLHEAAEPLPSEVRGTSNHAAVVG